MHDLYIINMEFKLPLRNKKQEIVDYTFVSEEDYEFLNKFKWSKTNAGYAQGRVEGKSYLLHRYVIIVSLNNDIDSHTKIDHIDNNRLNNTRKNLRIISNSDNCRNVKKQKNTSSIYMGVCFNKSTNLWGAHITKDKKHISARYKKEIHAAHQYNLWCIKFGYHTANLNIIDENLLDDFVLYKKKERTYNTPKYIYYLKRDNSYRVSISKVHYGIYKTVEEAVIQKEIILKKLKEEKLEKIYSQPIKRNNEGNCIITIFSKIKNKQLEIIVDEDMYYDLIQYKWHFTNNYIYTNNHLALHRHVMNYTGKDFVDHINGNTLDNRKENLRILTPKQNAMNRTSGKNTSSKYIGVHLNRKTNRWVSRINTNGRNIHLGTFDTEIEAAKARDEYTIKLFGEFGKLNLNQE
jgi:hypothetical protein